MSSKDYWRKIAREDAVFNLDFFHLTETERCKRKKREAAIYILRGIGDTDYDALKNLAVEMRETARLIDENLVAIVEHTRKKEEQRKKYDSEVKS